MQGKHRVKHREPSPVFPGFYQMKMLAELSLPLTRKVARQRRDGRREAIYIKFSLSLPQSFFKNEK